MPTQAVKSSAVTAIAKRYHKLLDQSRSLLQTAETIRDERSTDKLLTERFKAIEALSQIPSHNLNDIIAKMKVWASEKEIDLETEIDSNPEDYLIMSSVQDLLNFKSNE